MSMSHNDLNKKNRDFDQENHDFKNVYKNKLHKYYTKNITTILDTCGQVYLCSLNQGLVLSKTPSNEPSFDTWLYLGDSQIRLHRHFNNINEAAKFLDSNCLVSDLMSGYKLLNQGGDL